MRGRRRRGLHSFSFTGGSFQLDFPTIDDFGLRRARPVTGTITCVNYGMQMRYRIIGAAVERSRTHYSPRALNGRYYFERKCARTQALHGRFTAKGVLGGVRGRLRAKHGHVSPTRPAGRFRTGNGVKIRIKSNAFAWFPAVRVVSFRRW